MTWLERTPNARIHKPVGATDLVHIDRFRAFVDSIDVGAGARYTNQDAAGSISGFLTLRSRGTFDVPTPVQSGDNIGIFAAYGYQNAGYRDAAYVLMQADGVPSGNFVPGRMIFATGTSTGPPSGRLTLDGRGNLYAMSDDTYFAWDANQARLGIAKRSAYDAVMAHGSGTPWRVERASTPSINPAGATWTTELEIGTNGLITLHGQSRSLGGSFVVDAGFLQVFPNINDAITVTRGQGGAAYLGFQRDETPDEYRWRLGMDGTAETGLNEGSDFVLNRYDDAGVLLGRALLVDRRSGALYAEGLVESLGGSLRSVGVTSQVVQRASGAPADRKVWRWLIDPTDGTLALGALNDAENTLLGNAFYVGRDSSGNPVGATFTTGLNADSVQVPSTTGKYYGFGGPLNALVYDSDLGPVLASTADITFAIDSNNDNNDDRWFWWKKNGAAAGGGGAVLMALGEHGSLGLAVNPRTWGATEKAVQVGERAALWHGNAFTHLSDNTYYSGGYKALAAGAASRITLNAGTVSIHSAPAVAGADVAQAFVERVVFDANGGVTFNSNGAGNLVQKQSTIFQEAYGDAPGFSSGFTARRSRGSEVGKTNVVNSDVLWQARAAAWIDGAWREQWGMNVQISDTTVPLDSTSGTRVVWFLTAPNGGFGVERFIWDSLGNFTAQGIVVANWYNASNTAGQGYMFSGPTDNDSGFVWEGDGVLGVKLNSATRVLFDRSIGGGSSSLRPVANGDDDLGTASQRWRTIYSVNALNTSLAAHKQDFERIESAAALAAVMATPFWSFSYKGTPSIRQGGIVIGAHPGDPMGAHPMFVADQNSGLSSAWQGIAVVGAGLQEVRTQQERDQERTARLETEVAALRARLAALAQ